MKKFLFVLFLVIITTSIAMENKPSHHQSNGTFKNPEGSPERSGKVKWSWSCLLYTSPSPRDTAISRMPSSA